MKMGPSPYSDIGKRARDLLTKDYNFDHKFTLSVPSAAGMGLTATGVTKDQIFIGDISTQYKSGNTTVDVKVNTFSNVSTKVTVDEALPGIKTALSFNIPDQKSGKLSQLNVVVGGRFCTTRLCFRSSLITTRQNCHLPYLRLSPDRLLGFKVLGSCGFYAGCHLDVHYCNHHLAMNSSIGLNPTPVLEINAATGNKIISLGGEAAFDTLSASFTKYNAGIAFNRPDFSASLLLMDKGQTLKASYFHTVNSSTAIAAEMTHRFTSYKNRFVIGSSHRVDRLTSVKTRFSDNGKVGMLYQREWRPKSLVTLSAEYDTKATESASKLGIAIALKP